ncbi:MAG: DUF1385 domain-containing protein [bacterium]|nr:DUF1385 domain-containing protein [bacterium]MCY3651923.1 DUF1385 domain-containing protein [bacterium]
MARQSGTTVGGQAVLEGVMIRAPSAWSVAVRNPSGEIEAISHRLPRISSRSRWARIPLIRGVLVLGETLVLGFRALAWSGQRSMGEEEEPVTKGQMAGSMTIAAVLFVGIFIVIPLLVARWGGFNADSVWFHLIEAVIRIGLLVGYVWLIGRWEEIGRVYAYHGAEHMTIHAYEAGDPLDRDHIAAFRPEHPRCGTSFLLLVMLTAIVVFSVVGSLPWYGLIASRVVLIPVVAGISYELLKLGGARADRPLGRLLTRPGLWLQRLTTRFPEMHMIDVAVTALLSALSDEEVGEVLARGPIVPEALTAYTR